MMGSLTLFAQSHIQLVNLAFNERWLIPFVEYGKRAIELLALVHTDVCGSFDIQIRDGYTYFITFINDLSRYGYVYLMKHKSEAFKKFKGFRHEVEK